jgi:ribonuclease BN (tRNA processing enzyme)
MELTFLGRGSAFHTTEGNTSAYYKEKETVLLIDCGESVFARIQQSNLLQNVTKLYVIITHTHPDQIGSLGSLMFYAHYIFNVKTQLVLTPNQTQNNKITKLLTLMGVTSNFYKWTDVEAIQNNFARLKTCSFLKTSHSKHLFCYGLEFLDDQNKITYYSSDTNSTKYVTKYLKNKNLHKIYIDTSSLDYKGNPHLSLTQLEKIVPQNLRHKVYCMHLDNSSKIASILEKGFQVVEVK